MFTLLVTVVVLSVLYGLAWHNEPARKRVLVGRINKKQESHE
jgi:hypothetical protein